MQLQAEQIEQILSVAAEELAALDSSVKLDAIFNLAVGDKFTGDRDSVLKYTEDLRELLPKVKKFGGADFSFSIKLHSDFEETLILKLKERMSNASSYIH